MSQTAITRAAFDRLIEFTYSPQPEILWPGHQETPPNQGIWLEPDILYNEPNDFAWDDDACVDLRGFIMILVHFRPGTGLPEPVLLADALILHFQKGTALGPVRVYKRGWQSPPVDDNDHSFVPVSIPFMGLT